MRLRLPTSACISSQPLAVVSCRGVASTGEGGAPPQMKTDSGLGCISMAGCTRSSWYTHSSTSELCTLPSKNSVCGSRSNHHPSAGQRVWMLRRGRQGQDARCLRRRVRGTSRPHSIFACDRAQQCCKSRTPTLPNGPTSMRSTSWKLLFPENSTWLTRIDHFRSSAKSSSSCAATQTGRGGVWWGRGDEQVPPASAPGLPWEHGQTHVGITHARPAVAIAADRQPRRLSCHCCCYCVCRGAHCARCASVTGGRKCLSNEQRFHQFEAHPNSPTAASCMSAPACCCRSPWLRLAALRGQRKGRAGTTMK